MNINTEYYKTFYYVAMHKSFTAAAAALLNNQPNVTRTVKNLENALGCVLFARTRHGVELTAEGEKLFAHVKVAMEQLAAGEEALCPERAVQSGSVTIGVTEVALHCLLLPILKEYRRLYPGVHIRILNFLTVQALQAVRDGTVDLAVLSTPTEHSAHLIQKRILPVKEVVICSKSMPLPGGMSVSLAQLQTYPLIMLGKQTKTYTFYAEFFAAHGFPFAPEIEAASAAQVLPLVKSDLGFGFVPLDFVKNDPDVRVMELKEQIPLRYVCMVKHKEHTLNRAAKELERLMEAKQQV